MTFPGKGSRRQASGLFNLEAATAAVQQQTAASLGPSNISAHTCYLSNTDAVKHWVRLRYSGLFAGHCNVL